MSSKEFWRIHCPVKGRGTICRTRGGCKVKRCRRAKASRSATTIGSHLGNGFPQIPRGNYLLMGFRSLQQTSFLRLFADGGTSEFPVLKADLAEAWFYLGLSERKVRIYAPAPTGKIRIPNLPNVFLSLWLANSK